MNTHYHVDIFVKNSTESSRIRNLSNKNHAVAISLPIMLGVLRLRRGEPGVGVSSRLASEGLAFLKDRRDRPLRNTRVLVSAYQGRKWRPGSGMIYCRWRPNEFPRDSSWMVCYYLQRGDDDGRRPADTSKRRISLADTGYVQMEANTILSHTEYHPKGVSGCISAPAS